MIKKCFLLVILIIIILTACEKEEHINDDTIKTTEYNGMTIVEELGMKNVFESEAIELSLNYYFWQYLNIPEINFYDRMFVLDDKIYFTARIVTKSREDGFTNPDLILHSFDFNGENEEVIDSIIVNENAAVRFIWLDSQYNQITIEELNYNYTLNKFNTLGELIFSISLNNIFLNNEIISMVIGADDNIYIGSKKIIAVFSKEGSELINIKLDNTLSSFISAHNKRPIIKIIDSITYKFKYINLDTGDLEDIEMPLQSDISYLSNNNIFYGIGYDYYYLNGNGIYGYDITTNTLTKVFDFINSDIVMTDIIALIVVDSETMATISFDSIIYRSFFNILNKVPDDEIPDYKYLSVACIYPTGTINIDDRYLTSLITSFNKENGKYRVTLTNYFSQDAMMDPLLKLHNDIAAGNIPDLLFINDYIPFMNYSNDIFFDLNEYLKNDKELYDNLLPFFKESVEIKGKLTKIITKFRPTTLMGKVKNVGNKTNWSYRDMIELYNNMPKDKKMTYDMTRTDFINYTLHEIISECVDYEHAICNFNQQGFKDYLELLMILPDEIMHDDDYYDYYDEYIKSRTDEVLLSDIGLFSIFFYYDDVIKHYREEEVTIIGFPTLNGEHHTDHIMAEGFSIYNSSKNKEGAWEFIKYSLSDDYAKYSIHINSMLPTKTGVAVCSNLYMDSEHSYQDDFQKSPNIDKESFPGILIKVDDKLIYEFNKYIYSLNDYNNENIDIYNIINEELFIYFNTNKSINDTINAIQSRVSIYMSEKWG